MKNLSLILRIVAIVAALASAGLFFAAQGKLSEKQTQLESAQKATQATQAELETANGQIASLESQLNTEREALAETKRTLQSVQSEKDAAQQEVTRTQQQLREAKNQVSTLEDTARSLRADLVATEQKLAEASKEAEIAQLNERISELENANETLKTDLEAERASHRAITQATTKTLGTTGAAVQPASIGAKTTIASISAADGILILDNTPELGLTAGSQLTLIKDLKAYGKVQITKVTDTYAIANILPGSNTKELTEGATVKLLR